MGIVERVRGLFGSAGPARPGEGSEPRQSKGDEELDIEAVQRSKDRDRDAAYERLTDVDGRSG